MGNAPQEELFAGKFRMVRLLGRGAMGEVWLAEEVGPRNFRRPVAVKRLLATEGISDYARESFIAEAQVIARLDHPNVVRLIELGESDERGLYLVLEYIDGAALDRLIRKGGALSPAAVALIGREVARALDAVHTMTDHTGQNLGVVHRDVSPANILVGRDGRVRLSDFGVARIHGLGGEKTETGIFKGKLPYMPPEQALGEPFDGRADVFSLGITLFEGLIGGRLRKAETQGQLIAKIATERVARVAEMVPDVIPALAQAIDAANEFHAGTRIPSAGHLAHAMQAVLHGLGAGAEQAAAVELAERVAAVAGGAPASTTRNWSMALSGENPSLAMSGPQSAYVSTSGPHSSGPHSVGAPHSGPHGSASLGPSSLSGPSSLGTGSGPHASGPHGSGPHGGSGPHSQPTQMMATQAYHGSPASVPPQGPASVTRVASITDAQRSKPGSRTWIVAAAIAALMGVGAGSLFVMCGPPLTQSATDKTPAERADVKPSATPASDPSSQGAASAATGAAASSTASAEAPPAGSSGTPQKRAPGPRPPVVATSDSSAEATGPGTLQVTVSPWGNVVVDGVPRGTTPIGPISLAPGPHTVSVTNPDLGASRSATVKVVSGKLSSVGFDLKKAQ